jgi:hypothetical protein
LHRFDAHLRQHTIQAEKTILAVIGAPSEARRLVRIIYAALAEVEGILFGLENFAEANQISVANRISSYKEEVAVALSA